MRPLRLVLNVAACVLFPAAAFGALTYAGIDWFAARVRRTHPALDLAIASDFESWFPTPEVQP